MTCEAKLTEAKQLIADFTNSAIKKGLIEMSVAGFAVPSLILGNSQVFPSVRSTNTGFNNSTAASHSVNLPSSYNAGDLLIIIVASQNNCTATWNTPSGWTAMPTLNNAQNGATQGAVGVFYKVATGSEGSTVTCDLSASTWRMASVSYAIYNYTGTPEAAKSADSGSSTTVDPPAVSPTGATSSTKYLFLTLGAWTHSNNASDDPDGYSNAIQGQGSTATGATVRSLRKEVTGTTDNPNTFTITSSRWAAGTIAVKGSGGPGNASRILDSYSNVTGAWSVSRQLLSTFSSSRYTTNVGVQTLVDQTSSGRDLSAFSGTNEPTLVQVGPQSRAGLRFDGGNDSQLSSNLNSQISNTTGYIIACGILRTVDTNGSTDYQNDSIFRAFDSVGGLANIGFYFRNNAGTYSWFVSNYDSNDDEAGANFSVSPIGTVIVCEWRHEGGTLYGRMTPTGSSPGAWQSVSSGNSAAVLSTTSLRIGGDTSYFTEIDVFEVATMSSTQNDTLRDALVTNMLAHYG